MKNRKDAPIPAHDQSFRRIGQIVGAFGIKGQVKIDLLTDFVERFDVGTSLLLDGKPIVVESVIWSRGRMILKLSGIDTPEDAMSHQFAYLEGTTDFEPNLGADEYLTSDLIGLQVQTIQGESIGVVDDVVASPAHDIIQVGEVLIPAVKQFVKSVDLEKGVMIVELIEGMLPEDK